jgi:hypothetical protein
MTRAAVTGVVPTIPDCVEIVKEDDTCAVPKGVNVPVPAITIAKPPGVAEAVAVAFTVNVDVVWAGKLAHRRRSGKAVRNMTI